MSVSNSSWRATLVLLVVLVLATALAHPAAGSGKNLWTRRHSFRFFNDTCNLMNKGLQIFFGFVRRGSASERLQCPNLLTVNELWLIKAW